MKNGLIEWFAARAKEPSTWRGVGVFLAALGLLPAGAVESLVLAGGALVGVVEVLRREG